MTLLHVTGRNCPRLPVARRRSDPQQIGNLRREREKSLAVAMPWCRKPTPRLDYWTTGSPSTARALVRIE
jgi:hypothetical protein